MRKFGVDIRLGVDFRFFLVLKRTSISEIKGKHELKAHDGPISFPNSV